MAKMSNLKNIIVASMAKTIILVGICVIIFITVSQLFVAQKTARDEAIAQFDRIEHILNENASDLSRVESDLNQNDLTIADIIAYMLGNHPDMLDGHEHFREIAELMGVDEICIFDINGIMVGGTHPGAYGMTFDSGEQIAFFKPMLTDKSLRLSQGVVERSLDGKPYKYSAVWNKEGTYIVQVGKTAESVVRVKNKYDLSYIFSLIKVDSRSELYAIDADTGMIVGSTHESDVGHNIEEFGFTVETIKERGKGFHTAVVGINAYCVFEVRGSNLLGRVVFSRDLYEDIPLKILELSGIVIIFAITLSYMLTKQMENLVISNIQTTNEKLKAIAEGDFEQKLELRNSTDFSTLSDYINAMTTSLKDKDKYRDLIFNIVSQHSSRILYAYDLETHTTRPWDEESKKKDILSHLYANSYSDDTLEQNEYVLPESREEVKRFFGDIHRGVPSGELNIHIKLIDGQPKWYHFKYSTIFEGGKPITAVISIEDITESHEHYLSHLQNIQAMEHDADSYLMYIESDLVEDRIDSIRGSLITEEESQGTYTHNEFGTLIISKKFDIVDIHKSANYFDCDSLLHLYDEGERQLEGDLEVKFSDGETHWLKSSITLVEDPLNKHIKAFTRVTDVTEEQEKQMSLVRRADHDGMTGLLRRGVGEKRIFEYLSAHKEPGGILVAIDLDNLKGINDTLGHSQGDAAIIGIANTMKNHFREGDILVRTGGDEFIAFLPGAAKSREAVEKSLASLLRKLSAISIGENGERTIHCSMGCAVELPRTDTFASLYQRADMALYHVKRNGKNDFAFFEPEMLEDDYRFKKKQALPVIDKQLKENELEHLLEIVAEVYPGVVMFNLTQNYFHIMTTGSNVEQVHEPDKIEVFWENWKNNIHPQDLDNTVGTMSRDSLMDLYVQGQHSTKHYFRNLETDGYEDTEIAVQFFTTEEGDICAFLFFRWEGKDEEE